jgi:hypothetical protein
MAMRLGGGFIETTSLRGFLFSIEGMILPDSDAPAGAGGCYETSHSEARALPDMWSAPCS